MQDFPANMWPYGYMDPGYPYVMPGMFGGMSGIPGVPPGPPGMMGECNAPQNRGGGGGGKKHGRGRNKGKQQSWGQGDIAAESGGAKRVLPTAKKPKDDKEPKPEEPQFSQLKSWLLSKGVKELDKWGPLTNQDKSDVMRRFIKGNVWAYSQNPEGSRIVQGAFSNPIAESRELVKELQSHVRDAIASAHANHVIAAAIAEFTFPHIRFILEELEGLGPQLSVHPYGCRIMCRLIEHFPNEKEVKDLLATVLDDPMAAASLCPSQFGRHVAEAVLVAYQSDQLGEKEKEGLTKALQGNLRKSAENRHASYVVEKLLDVEKGEEKDGMDSPAFTALANELLGENLEHVEDLAVHQSAQFVLTSLLEKSEKKTAEVLSWLRDRKEQEWSDKVQKVSDLCVKIGSCAGES